jgi:hypothetical protein
MSIDALRRKQIKEVLDEDYRISQVVFLRDKERVKTMDEVVKQASLADKEKELDTDNLVAKFDEITRRKISDLQFFIGSNPAGKPPSTLVQSKRYAFTSVVDYASLVSVYNSIILLHNKKGLANSSREAIALKIQSLSEPLQILCEGLFDYISNEDKLDVSIVEIMRAFTTYNLIRTQINQNLYYTINDNNIQTAFDNYILGLSENKRVQLSALTNKELGKERTLQKIAYNSNDFAQRMRGIEDALGVSLTNEEKKYYQSLPTNELDKEIKQTIQKARKAKRDKIRKEEEDWLNSLNLSNEPVEVKEKEEKQDEKKQGNKKKKSSKAKRENAETPIRRTRQQNSDANMQESLLNAENEGSGKPHIGYHDDDNDFFSIQQLNNHLSKRGNL